MFGHLPHSAMISHVVPIFEPLIGRQEGHFRVVVKTLGFTCFGGHNRCMISEPEKIKVPRSEGIYIYVYDYKGIIPVE